jgi:hypothetical protein
VLTQPGVVLADPSDRVSNGAGDACPSPFRRRRGAPFTTTETEGPRELPDEEIALGLGLGGPR